MFIWLSFFNVTKENNTTENQIDDDVTPTNNVKHPGFPAVSGPPEFVVKSTLYQELDELVLEFKGENSVTRSSDLNLLLKYKDKDLMKILELGYNGKQYEVIREVIKLLVKRKGKLGGWTGKGWGRKVTDCLKLLYF